MAAFKNSLDLAANIDTDLKQIATGKTGTDIVVIFCNRATTSTLIRLAFVDPLGTLGNKDYLFFDRTVDGNNSLQIKDIRMPADSKLVARANAINMSVTVWGDEA